MTYWIRPGDARLCSECGGHGQVLQDVSEDRYEYCGTFIPSGEPGCGPSERRVTYYFKKVVECFKCHGSGNERYPR